MRETYIRPWWHHVLIFFLVLGITNIVLFGISYGINLLLLEGNPIAKNSVFGSKPVWIVNFAAFAIMSPIFAFIFFGVLRIGKYDYEWLKLKLIPFNPHKPEQPLFDPRPIEGKEPVWKENYMFEAKLEPIGSESLGRNNYVVVKDENDVKYVVSGPAFDYMQNFKNDDGLIEGVFTFDVKRRHHPIMICVTKEERERIEQNNRYDV